MKVDSLTAITLILIGNTITGLGLRAISRGYLGKIPGIAMWAEACLMQSVGWLLVGPLRPLVGTLVSIAIGYGILAYALSRYLKVLGDFSGQPVNLRAVHAGLVFQTVFLAYFVVFPDMNVRLMVATPVSGVILLACARVLHRSPSRDRPIERFNAALFITGGGFLVLRGLYEAGVRVAPGVVRPEWRLFWDNLTFLNFFVNGTLLSFGFLLLVTDRYITERNLAAQALESSLREKESLLRETHHRVKNNIALIASLMRVTAHDSESPETKAVLRDMLTRLQSVSLLNETLYRTASYSRVDLGAYIRKIATHGLNATAAGRVRLNLELEAVEVETAQAIPCGLIVNELLTNSLKHAFGDGSEGELSVRLGQREDGAIVLRVSDSGPGLAKDFPAQAAESFGLQLVADLAQQLQGSIESGPGSAFTLVFRPQSRSAVDLAATTTPWPTRG